MPTHEALRIAQSRSLDLVEITAAAKPPVCKIVDFGKYNYEKQKKEKSQKKNQVVMTVKEIRFNANTDTHDIDFKTKHLRQFIIDGHKVKTSVLYKGRMITHPEIGEKLMNEVLEKLTDIAKIESPPKLEGKMLTTYLVPDKHKVQSYKARLAKEQKMREQAEKMQGDKPAAEQHPEQSVEPPAEETKDNGKQ
jgi:translation initiation factor IF-3